MGRRKFVKNTTLFKQKINLPIYDATIWLIITEDIIGERKKMQEIFGNIDGAYYNALCSYDNHGNFALFFEPTTLTDKIIAHEIFHLTHRILDWTSGNFDKNHHEQGALLCGYLTEWVQRSIKKIK